MKSWGWTIILSLVVHAAVAVTFLWRRQHSPRSGGQQSVHMSISRAARPATQLAAKSPAVAPPVKPKVMPSKKKKVASEKIERTTPVATPEPLEEVTQTDVMDSTTTGPSSESPIAALASLDYSAGNGRAGGDADGKDLSAGPTLIHSTLSKPAYTTEALYAEIEGYYPVDVQVDSAGNVVDAEMQKNVGFGMDERIVVAIRSARFLPAKDELGKPISGWTNIKFKLEIPR